MRPETRFARSGDLYIAYQVAGEGERDFVQSFGGPTHLEALWEIPEIAGTVEQLTHLGRVIVYDKRGAGLSDRPPGVVTLEERATDLVAVMDAAGSEQAVLVGSADGAAASLVTAALFPHRVSGVVASQVLASFLADAEHPWGMQPEAAEMFRHQQWGEAGSLSLIGFAPDPRLAEGWRRWERMAATPAAALWSFRSMMAIDLRPYLSRIHAPVLIVRPDEDFLVDPDGVTWLAEHLPDARVVDVPGRIGSAILPGGPVLDEIEEFVVGTRTSATTERALRVVLVTDLVGSTALLDRLGEDGWRRLLGSHRAVVRAALARYGGTEIDTAGDGFLATFELPTHALRCAQEIRDVCAGHGVAVRQGIDAGEVSVLPDGIAGLAVHAAARVAGHAGAGEVLVTETVLALATGNHAPCDPVGARVLKGIPGRRHLYRLGA